MRHPNETVIVEQWPVALVGILGEFAGLGLGVVDGLVFNDKICGGDGAHPGAHVRAAEDDEVLGACCVPVEEARLSELGGLVE